MVILVVSLLAVTWLFVAVLGLAVCMAAARGDRELARTPALDSPLEMPASFDLADVVESPLRAAA